MVIYRKNLKIRRNDYILVIYDIITYNDAVNEKHLFLPNKLHLHDTTNNIELFLKTL